MALERRLLYMKDVIMDKKWCSSAEDRPLYFMSRALYKTNEDEVYARQAKLRYDLTVIPAGELGMEFVKTAGHYHKNVPGTDLTFPEVYQVIEGSATYILQKKQNEKVIDVIIIHAEIGDMVVIPPGYGHVTVNPGCDELKMANWVSSEFDSDYSDYVRYQGAAYYLLADNTLVANNGYGKLPQPRIIKNPDFKSVFAVDDMYELVSDLRSLEFLNRPDKYSMLFRFAKTK